MAKQNISHDYMKEIYKNEGESGVVNVLSEKFENGKPKITKDKKVLNKIINTLI